MGPVEGAEVDGGKSGVVDEVEDGEGVEGAAAVVGDVGGGAVGGGDDFVGVGAYGEGVEDFEGGGVDDGESVVVLAEGEEGGLGERGGGEGYCEEGGCGAERESHGERLLRFGFFGEGLHEVGYGGLGGVVEGAETFDYAGLVGGGAVLVELALAF